MRIRRSAAAAFAVAAVVFLAGCGNGNGQGSGSGTESPSASEAAGPLALTLDSPPISLDPAKTNTGAGEAFVDLAYGALIHQNAQGDYEPWLAESFEYVGEGATHFRITLREGLLFADGTPLDSAAVKGYLEYFKSAGGPFAQVAGNIESIETPDDLTVEVLLSAPNPEMPYQFSESGLWGAIVSPAGLADPEALGASTAGAGPYQLDEAQTVTGSSYVYVPNGHYFDKSQQRWSSVTITIITDTNAALQSVLSGASDWTPGVEDQRETAKDAGLIEELASPSTLQLFLLDRDGTQVPALGDQRVRQALNYAVDRDAIADLMGGVPSQQIIPESGSGHNPAADEVYSYDIEKAKQLLAEAGYADGFSFRALSGSFDALGSRVLEVIAAQLAEIGVDVEIVQAPTFGDFSRESESAQYPAMILPWGGTAMYSIAQQIILPDGIANAYKAEDPEFSALFEQGASQSGAEAEATWQELSLKVTERAWFVTVAVTYSPFFGKDHISPAGDSIGFPNPVFF